MKKEKIFYKKNGYLEKDFLHFGYDHIDTGLTLLKEGLPYQFSSAGYLIHLVLELILKAFHIHEFGKFSVTHNIGCLFKSLNKKLSAEDQKALKLIDQYYLHRYPRMVEGPIEIGQDDLVVIESFLSTIWGLLPNNLREEYNKIDPLKKGGNILMEKRNK